MVEIQAIRKIGVLGDSTNVLSNTVKSSCALCSQLSTDSVPQSTFVSMRYPEWNINNRRQAVSWGRTGYPIARVPPPSNFLIDDGSLVGA